MMATQATQGLYTGGYNLYSAPPTATQAANAGGVVNYGRAAGVSAPTAAQMAATSSGLPQSGNMALGSLPTGAGGGGGGGGGGGITQLGASPAMATTNVGTQSGLTSQASAPPPGYDPNNPYGSTWTTYNATHPNMIPPGSGAGDGTFNAAYNTPGDPNFKPGNTPATGGAYAGQQYGAPPPPNQEYDPATYAYLQSLPGLPAGQLEAELGGMHYDPNSYANQQAAALQMQAGYMANRNAPQIDTSAVNFINSGAGKSLNEADATNLYGVNAALQLAGTANGAAAQGQLGTAQQLSNAANGAGVMGGLAAGSALAGAASGPAAQGQLNSSNALMGAAYGPALMNQYNTAGQLSQAANGPGVAGLYSLGGQLASSAYGANAANQSALANQLAGTAYGPTMQGQLGLANQLVKAGALPAGDSVAQLQLQQGADKSMAQQAALASAARGGNTALALQNSAQNQGQIMGQLNQSQALLRAQEDINNRNLQAQTIGQAAGLYGQAGAQQAQALGAAAGLYGSLQGQQASALQGAGSLYGNAGGLQGSLLGAAGQQYGSAAQTQGSILGAANQGYGQAAQTQGQLLGASGQAYNQAGQLQGSLLGAANQGYGAALAGQQGAYGGAGQLLQGVASNQLGQANTQGQIAGIYGQLAQAQLGAQTAQNQLNQQGQLASQGMGYGLQENQLNAFLNADQAAQQRALQTYAIDKGYQGQIYGTNAQQNAALTGGLIQGGATTIAALLPLLAASDIRGKTKIAPASGEVADAFRPLTSSSYLYKDPNAPGAVPGTQYGPMAQQLEQTPAGSTAVTRMPDGKKGIDTGRLALMNASATADMMRRLDKVEAQADAIRGANVMGPMGGASDMHLRPDLAPGVPQGAARPFAPGEYVSNPDGSWSSERTMTVQNPDGSWSVIPSVWVKDGRPYEAKTEDEAQSLAMTSRLPFQKFGSLDQAEKYANEREASWQPLSRPEDAAGMPSLWAPQQAQSPQSQGMAPNVLYQVPQRAPAVMRLPQAPTAVASTRAPMQMSTPTPGAVFGRYGTPDFDYGGMPDSAPAQVYMPTAGDFGIAYANNAANQIRGTQIAYPQPSMLYGGM